MVQIIQVKYVNIFLKSGLTFNTCQVNGFNFINRPYKGLFY